MPSEISAQILVRSAFRKIGAQQPLQSRRYFGRWYPIPDRPRHGGIFTYCSADAEVVSIHHLAFMLDLLAFQANIGDPVLAASIGAARHVQFQLLIELRDALLKLLNQPARKSLRF